MNEKKIGMIALAVLAAVAIVSQFARIMTFFRTMLTGKITTDNVIKKVASDSGSSVGTVASLIRTEYCKGVASALFGYLHEKPLGFLPISIFGSTENEEKIIEELNSLKNGKESQFVSSYYYEKYKLRLKGLLTKYMSTSEYNKINSEIRNNLS